MTGSEAPHRLPTAAKVNLAALAILAGALSAHLWPEWSGDPDLSHGFLVPVACLLLLVLSRRTDGRGALSPRAAAALAAGLGAASLAGLWVSGLFASNLDWASPLVDFTLAGSFALLLGAGIAAFADRRIGWVPFGWASLAAALIWALGSPVPPGTYTRLTLALQLWVSESVMRTLDLLGVAAHRQGNIIELARGSVGIEEACSGVRSLISCVFAGVLFSAALVRRPWARVLLIALSAPLALAMNFVRSLVLTLLVNRGVRVEGAWHDATGYAVLGVTAALLVALAILLDRPEAEDGRARETAPAAAGTASPATPAPQVVLACVVALAAATLAYFAAEARAPSGTPGKAPDLLSILPDRAPGWRVRTDPDLHLFSGTLRTRSLAQRTYVRDGASGREEITLYMAFWQPGQASVGLVESHTPDACWPGTGWVARPVPDAQTALEVAGRPLPVAEHRLFVDEGFPQHVWFWHFVKGRPIQIKDPYSIGALLKLGVHYGFSEQGEQYFVRVSSNRTWDEISGEPVLEDFFGRARGLGLY